MPNAEQVIEQLRNERRRFRRVDVRKPGKLFLPKTAQELGCMVDDISPGGAEIHCDFILNKGERIVLYVDDIGRFEGNIARIDGAEAGIAFSSTPMKRERTAELLTMFLNREEVDTSHLRRHERVTVAGRIGVTRAGGDVLDCKVHDVSLSGLFLETEARPPIGEFVLVGPLAAHIVRHTPSGFGVEFLAVTFPNITSVAKRMSLKIVGHADVAPATGLR